MGFVLASPVPHPRLTPADAPQTKPALWQEAGAQGPGQRGGGDRLSALGAGVQCVRAGWIRGIWGPEGVAGAWHSHAGRRGPVLTSVTSTSGQLRADSISDGIQ